VSSARPTAPPTAAGTPGRTAAGAEPLDAATFIAGLDRDNHLTQQQRDDLVRLLREAATMQARIDLDDDPDDREEMQGKLIHQLVVRLRFILGEEGAKGPALALVEKKPRIVYK
jgi:hypothetical protein